MLTAQQGGLEFPAQIDNTLAKSKIRHTATRIFRPHGEGLCFTEGSIAPDTPRVAVLLGNCRPSAIIGLVGAVVVDAIETEVISIPMRQRPCPKSRIIKKPVRVNGNPSCPVVTVILAPSVDATVYHMPPCLTEPALRITFRSGLPI